MNINNSKFFLVSLKKKTKRNLSVSTYNSKQRQYLHRDTSSIEVVVELIGLLSVSVKQS